MEEDFSRTMKILKIPTTSRYQSPAKRKITGKVYTRPHAILDYNPIYGGYQPMVVLRGSAQTYFDRQTRMSPAEMKAFYGLRKGRELARRGARKQLLYSLER
jgi:hypothetical protein